MPEDRLQTRLGRRGGNGELNRGPNDQLIVSDGTQKTNVIALARRHAKRPRTDKLQSVIRIDGVKYIHLDGGAVRIQERCRADDEKSLVEEEKRFGRARTANIDLSKTDA